MGQAGAVPPPGDRVLVLGAGLSGLAAADRLLDAGLCVTLVDAFPVPGGRVASFEVSTPVAGLSPGDVVEHGLHAWFQHYHALFALMARAGIDKPPLAGEGVHLWHPGRGHVVIRGGPAVWLVNALRLPGPVRGGRREALAALARLTADLGTCFDDPRTDAESALARMRRFGVPEAAIDHVFRPCLYSLTSLRLEDLSALEMMRWLSRILPDPRVRCLDGGGTRAMCAPIAAYLEQRGADLRLGVEVTRLSLGADGRVAVAMEVAPDRTGVRHVLVPGFSPGVPPDAGEYDAVISTLPWERLLALSDASLRALAPEVFAGMEALDNVHPLTLRLWFERPIVGAVPGYILASGTLFDVLRPTPEPARHEGIRLVDALVENVDTHLPELGYDVERYVEPGEVQRAILERVVADLERLYPGQIRDNPLQRCFVHTREGVVACRPGAWEKRAPAFIGSQRFFLAGDWTRQPFGVCMEGAVRSGQLAAESLLAGKAVEPRLPPYSQVAFSVRSLFEFK